MKELTADDIQGLVGTSPLILEIGANDGTDTLKFLQAMPDATIYCFEPDPRAIARFKENVDDSRITLIELAASNENGYGLFHGSSGRPPQQPNQSHYCDLPEWDLSGSLFEPTGHLARSEWVTFPKDRQCQVKTTRLDTWLESHPEIERIDFQWIDVQGAESIVIPGAQEAMKRTQYCYFEFSDIELYRGDLPLEKLRPLFPGGVEAWDLLGIHGENALLENVGFPLRNR